MKAIAEDGERGEVTMVAGERATSNISLDDCSETDENLLN